MKATSILVAEHCLIEQVLNCLERMLDRCALQRKLVSAPARDAIVFLRGFAERCHYTKEETELLPTMRAIGISSERCMGCSMLQRRDEGRLHVDAMERAIEPASRGDSRALKEFTEHAQAYIELLLDYIARQEDCLFPMISQALPETDRARLGTALHTANGDGRPGSAYAAYVDLANRLADHFDVPRAAIAGSSGNRNAMES